MKPHLGLSEKNLQGSVTALNKLLAQEYVLYTKTLNYHWNVVDPNFHALHLFFRELYEKLFEIVDDVAERARSLGGIALGSLQEFSRLSKLEEDLMGAGGKSAQDMMLQMLKDHETIIEILRKDVDTTAQEFKDEGTSNFLTDIMEKHEKMAWMLRASVTKAVVK